MSTTKWFISILILIVFCAVIWVHVLKPGFTRLSNYVYLFFILSKIRPYDPQDLLIKSASVLIQYDPVVLILDGIRNQPIRTTKELNYSRKILSELRRKEYSEVDILRAAITMLRQYTSFGFDALPVQVMEPDIIEITDIITLSLSKQTDFKPVDVVFFILLGNKNLSHYMK